jgi:hypothetical protein
VKVDLVLSDRMTTEITDEIETEFRSLGLVPTVRLLRTRRSAELSWMILATLPLASFLNALGSYVAEDTFRSLRRLLGRAGSRQDRAPAAAGPRTLVLRDTESTTEVILDPDLSIEGYRALLASDLSVLSGTTMRYDPVRRSWVTD